MTTWILVADGFRARLFSAGKHDGEMEEIASFVHPEGRMHGSELTRDKPPASQPGFGGGSHGIPPRTEVQQKVSQEFARELADLLEEGRVGHAFDAVTLVADPKFLGVLRATLSDELSKLVVKSLAKDYTTSSLEQIRQTLKDV